MLATVVLPDGPQEMEIVPMEGSPDHLAIIKDLAEDPTAASIVAQIPGHDAWTPMACPMGTVHPSFPVGHVPQYLRDVIAHLPRAVERYVTGQESLAPSRIALARYLKILPPDLERQAIELLEAQRQADVQESREREEGGGDPDRPTPEDELDRLLRERDEIQANMASARAKEAIATYHGFLDGKSHKEVTEIRHDLERLVLVEDALTPPVKNLIEQLVSQGCIVQDDPNDGKPILFDPATKTGMRQQDLTRSGIDYARFLISLGEPKT